MAVGTRMQQRRATAADWNTSGYVLAAGELGITTDTGIIKIGDGVNAWSALDPAFDSQYLPILGQAADSALLGGISAASFVKVADTSVTATNNTYVKRTADGGVKGTDATEDGELTTLSQMNAAVVESVKHNIVRTVTADTTIALTDIGKMVMVNHSSLTTQVKVTVPKNSVTAFPIGSRVDICANGAGGVQIIPVDGTVTLRPKTTVFPNYGVLRLVKINTDTWMGIELNQTKKPKVKLLRSSGGQAYGTQYNFVPYNSIDASETYNPDNEWFSVPGTGLSTARRIIINKDGEYLFNLNFASTGTSAITYARIAKMTADNSTSGMKIIGVGIVQAVCCFSMTKKVTAGESFGIHHGFATGCVDTADDEAGGNNPNNFMITRVGD